MGIIATKLFFKPPAPSNYQYDEYDGFKGKFFEMEPETKSRNTILFCHDVGTDIAHFEKQILNICKFFACDVLAVEYNGFPETQNVHPTEESILSNVESGFNYLLNVKKIEPNNIVLIGHGLGCSPCVDIALKYNIECILFAPFTSWSKLYLNNEKLWNLPGDMFQISSKFHQLKSSVILVHGAKDEIVPYQHSILLVESRKFTPFINITNANHNDLFEDKNLELIIASVNSIYKSFERKLLSKSPSKQEMTQNTPEENPSENKVDKFEEIETCENPEDISSDNDNLIQN